MVNKIENRLLTSGYGLEILGSLLFPIHKLSRENTQAKNLRDIFFEKVQDRVVTVNRTSVNAEAAI